MAASRRTLENTRFLSLPAAQSVLCVTRCCQSGEALVNN